MCHSLIPGQDDLRRELGGKGRGDKEQGDATVANQIGAIGVRKKAFWTQRVAIGVLAGLRVVSMVVGRVLAVVRRVLQMHD